MSDFSDFCFFVSGGWEKLGVRLSYCETEEDKKMLIEKTMKINEILWPSPEKLLRDIGEL